MPRSSLRGKSAIVVIRGCQTKLPAFDEASAADGPCPLEQIADASGIAVGGSVVPGGEFGWGGTSVK